MNEEKFNKVNVFGKGEENTAFRKYFIGNSYLNHLVKAPIGMANVTLSHHVGTTGISMKHLLADVKC